ncbi:MAG: sulfotransferase [Steroidobacteraceae bacterium]
MKSVIDPESLIQLACADLHRDEIGAAQAKCLQALDADPHHAGAWTVLGMVLQGQGRLDDAIRVFNSLTLRNPNDAGHWLNFGGALRSAKRYQESLAAYDRAAALDPPTAALLYNMGLVYIELFDYPSAYSVLKQGAEKAPKDAWIQCTLAQCCYDLGNFEETLAVLEPWQKFEGLTPDNLAQIATLLISIGELSRATPAMDRLLEHPPAGGRGALTLINTLERMNRLDDARAIMQRLKADALTNPDDPDVLLAQAILAQREGADEDACALLSRALTAQIDPARRCNVLFPLAKSLDALRRYEQAFDALSQAHVSQVLYLERTFGKAAADSSPTASLLARAVEPGDVARWDNTGAPPAANSPIFIVGFPRSGTTLLEQILDSHPLLKSMDEQPFLRRAVEQVSSLGIVYPDELGRLRDDQLQGIRQQYWARAARKVTLLPGQRLVDKNPLNIFRLPLIHRLFPHAHVILAIRHPFDTIISCFAQQFRALDLAMLCRDLPTLASTYKSAFDFWYQQVALLPAQTYELKYEQLVSDFPAQVRRLAAFLNLPWEESMLAPAMHAAAKGYISTPSYAQVVLPVNAQSVGRWTGYRRHFETVLPVLQPYLDRWGYPA